VPKGKLAYALQRGGNITQSGSSTFPGRDDWEVKAV
jgi:hypothetical protein